ncbi:thiamine-phosphate kinase [Flagellatimonas centrodinii]|uniref:thiamine-phosphate kinase n=1 Tax=Flagellatimonas centrodinii TaxID=2806210 RepID=UPI001FEE8588|nr:thiamine-phosphate kinase [Flagellatimonas centrodinii]ULQ46195.1 thiamine-phosphate kinase [Flagellatimonas centrodinii]
MREFDLIRTHFGTRGGTRPEVLLGIGDDTALLDPPAGQIWSWSIDTLVEGVHFAATDAAADVGWKALAVNLSDLAAMGAAPVSALLALTLPVADDDWLAGFSDGFAAMAAHHGVVLAGGDTTRGPRSISVTVLGTLPADQALRRDGAQVGDVIAVTGTLGDAALALQLGAGAPPKLRARLTRPEPRVAAGLALRGLASAAIDLSDGLLADLGHVMSASGTGAAVRVDLLPTSAAFLDAVPAGQATALQTSGGDDYELCVCLPPERVADAVVALAALSLPLTVIGRVCVGQGDVNLLHADGRAVDPGPRGYQHF